MTIAERVNALIAGGRPAAFCDDCITNELDLSRRQFAHRVTGILGATDNFVRQRGACSTCGKTKTVIYRT
jgi:hypothetical protein